MILDLQIIKDNQELRHRSNLDWAGAHAWLQESKVKGTFDSIQIQIYETVFTDKGNLEPMPWDSTEDLLDFEAAHKWLEREEKMAKFEAVDK